MFKLFKNSRSARRHLPHVLLNLQAVDKQLKPCYLWDSFNADINEIQNYLNELNSSGKINLSLSVFSVNDTYFVTQKELLKDYLDIFASESVNVVDVSKGQDEPTVLEDDEKLNALNPIIKHIRMLLQTLMDNGDKNINVECNVTTLYGTLLGYPVLYWYESQKAAEVNFSCLSMVPLVVYRVSNSDNRLYENEIFAFSTPQSLSGDNECIINNWFTGLVSKCQNSIFNNLNLSHGTVTLPYISM